MFHANFEFSGEVLVLGTVVAIVSCSIIYGVLAGSAAISGIITLLGAVFA